MGVCLIVLRMFTHELQRPDADIEVLKPPAEYLGWI